MTNRNNIETAARMVNRQILLTSQLSKSLRTVLTEVKRKHWKREADMKKAADEKQQHDIVTKEKKESKKEAFERQRQAHLKDGVCFAIGLGAIGHPQAKKCGAQ